MTEPGGAVDPEPVADYVVRSVTISNVIDATGREYITYDTEGDPSDWDVLGMIDYIAAVLRNHAALGTEDDEDDD